MTKLLPPIIFTPSGDVLLDTPENRELVREECKRNLLFLRWLEEREK